MSHDNLPVKILKPSCLWKKRKGDVKMPTKQDGLLVRRRETNDRSNMSLEEYLKTTPTIFETYQKDHKGSTHTMDIIETMMKQGEADVANDGALPIVHPPGTTTVVGSQSASV